MNKKILITLLFSAVFTQTSLTNEQLDLIKEELSNEVESELNMDENVEDVNFEEISIDFEPESSIVEDEILYYGYSYFNNDLNFFDNIPTPIDYRLGAGDEVIISLWGEINLRQKFLINKEGLIYYENLGFINISNMTISEAEKILKNKLQNIYSTLKSDVGSSDLMIEISKIKSLNIYFSGEIKKPGVHLIHPFSDIFTALIQSGGPTTNGSLRAVQLIRNNKIVSTTDLYSFFKKGINSFSSEKIVNGDVINIPPVGNRILVEGEIVNEGYFEILETETVTDLIEFAGGLTSKSSSFATLDKVIPIERRRSDDNAYSSEIIVYKDFSDKKLTDGSTLLFPSIGEVNTKVEILGQVKSPGFYPANLTLKKTLMVAGGFDDPVFRQTIRDEEILILRKDKKQLYGLEYKVSYNNSQDFKTLPGDKIFVYENTKFDNSFQIEVSGEVNKRGFFPHSPNMTIANAIQLAEGFTELANTEGIIVTQKFINIDVDGEEVEEIIRTNDISMNFQVEPGSKINVIPKTQVVSIVGNVYTPGLVTYSGNKSVGRYIKLAGGIKPNTLKSKIYVQRANGRTQQTSFLGGIGLRIYPGDTIIVPENPNPSEFDVAAFTADILSVLSNLAAILVIVENSSSD
jgi:protein involved in polysaccharide export with SLBB domain